MSLRQRQSRWTWLSHQERGKNRDGWSHEQRTQRAGGLRQRSGSAGTLEPSAVGALGAVPRGRVPPKESRPHMGRVGLCWRSAPCKVDLGSQTGTKGGQSLMERRAHQHSKKEKEKRGCCTPKTNVFYISIKLQRKKRGRGQHSDPVEAEWFSWYAHNHTAQAEGGCFKACLWIRGIFTEKKKQKGSFSSYQEWVDFMPKARLWLTTQLSWGKE